MTAAIHLPSAPEAAVPRSSTTLWIISGAALVVMAYLTLSNSWPYGSDDSLFYLVIANRLADGDGVTFNGLMATNGVQPLWQAIVGGVAWLGRGVGIATPLGQVRALVVLGWIIIAATLGTTWKMLGSLTLAPLARQVGLVVVGVALCGPWGMFGSEGHLMALLTIALLYTAIAIIKSERPTWTPCVLFGILSGFVMLTRLDAVWFVGTLVVFTFWPRRGIRPDATRLWQCAAACALAAAVVAPYLIWNVVQFGHPMPISGAIKVHVGMPAFNLRAVGPVGPAMLIATWTIGAWVMWRSRNACATRIWLATAIGATVSTSYYVLFSIGSHNRFYWYLLVHLASLAIVIAVGCDLLIREGRTSARRNAVLATVLACALVVAGTYYCVTRRSAGPGASTWSSLIEFSEDVRSAVPDGERIATVDFPGVLALLNQGRDVVALDGLTGDFEFQDDLRDLGVSCTMAQLDVRWLVTENAVPATPQPDGETAVLEYSSWLHREPPSRAVVRLDDEVPATAGPRGYRLWRIEPSC